MADKCDLVLNHVESSKNINQKLKSFKKDSTKTRLKRLRNDNVDEDVIIKQLGKKLRLKSNAISQSFQKDGLDYLLEVCESVESSNDYDELRETGQKVKKALAKESVRNENNEDGAADKSDGIYEDIYGRRRNKNGPVLEKTVKEPIANEKVANSETNTKLKRSLNGLLNRLAESNMHSIAKQVEGLYGQHSRHEMNENLIEVMNKDIIRDIRMPERMIVEHVMLIAILHANIGYEIGAQFLENFVTKFHKVQNTNPDIENKQLDNLTHVLAQMYNFKIFQSELLFEILQVLSKQFKEKDIECILHILRTVGFTLRKDNPGALKNLILELQQKAKENCQEEEDMDARVKFLLEILLAIKNNNMSKIPNYDPTYSEHLKKILKTFIRKGHSISSLNIKLKDILNVETRGRWWIVGSAWTGKEEGPKSEVIKSKTLTSTNDKCPLKFNEKLLELARKQHMNTDVRKNVFCILMSAEDYMDAFEKLLKLNLKSLQEREIIHVIVHCCLQEKTFNPYYAVLVQQFCEYNKTFLTTVRYCIWDRIKVLKSCSSKQIDNLACFLSHLFISSCLSITTLKVIEFNELETVSMSFTRSILLKILLHDDEPECLQVFQRISKREKGSNMDDKLKLFRKSVRLFIHHFLLTNLDSDDVKLSDNQRVLIRNRVAILDKFL